MIPSRAWGALIGIGIGVLAGCGTEPVAETVTESAVAPKQGAATGKEIADGVPAELLRSESGVVPKKVR